MASEHHLRQFLLFVFALLIPCFALWTVAADALAMPVVGLVDMLLEAWFPAVVDSLVIQDGEPLLLTRFGELGGVPVPPEQSEYQLGFRINPAILSYSIPFYATLHFATQKDEYLGSFLWGLLVLYLCFFLGLVSLCLKQLMVNLGALFMEQQDVFVPPADAIALTYQLSVLIVPTLVPVLVWAWQSRETPLMGQILSLTGQNRAAGESQ